MTQPEFKQWLDFHCSMFAGIRDWLRRKGLNAGQIIDAWQRSLSEITLEEAKSASCRLWESESCPKTYDRHPVEVKRYAKSIAVRNGRHVEAERSDGAVKCRRCKDIGLITVFYLRKVDSDDEGTVIQVRELFDPGMVAAHVLSEGNERDVRTCCVRCTCGPGDQWACHPLWRESLLISEGCAAARAKEGFWECVLDHLGAPGANSTTAFSQLATAGMGEF